MKLIKLKCDNCGATLKVNQELNNITCTYCGNEIMIDDEATNLDRIENVKLKIRKKTHEQNIIEQKEKYELQKQKAKDAMDVMFKVYGLMFGLGFLMFLALVFFLPSDTKNDNDINQSEKTNASTDMSDKNENTNDNSNSKEELEDEHNDIKEGKIYYSKMPISEEKILKNIKVKFEKNQNGHYIAFITNNNSFVIPDLDINVNFYEDGNIVDTTKDGHDAILPGYTVVSEFESFENFDDAKYDITINWGTSYINHSDYVKLDYNINKSGDVLVSITNNDEELIEEIEIIAVFYDKDGNTLGTSWAKDIYDVASGKTVTEKLYLKDFNNNNKIEKVKIYINQAHTF